MLLLSKRAIAHGDLSSRQPDTRALCYRQAALRSEQHARLRTVLDQLPHLGHLLLGRRNAFLLARFVQTQKSHRNDPLSLSLSLSFLLWQLTFPAFSTGYKPSLCRYLEHTPPKSLPQPNLSSHRSP